jgi:hypothetical protein
MPEYSYPSGSRKCGESVGYPVVIGDLDLPPALRAFDPDLDPTGLAIVRGEHAEPAALPRREIRGMHEEDLPEGHEDEE